MTIQFAVQSIYNIISRYLKGQYHENLVEIYVNDDIRFRSYRCILCYIERCFIFFHYRR